MRNEQTTLFDMLTPKINIAKENILEAFKFSQHLNLGKLYVAFSGGKDSVAVYGICKLAAKKLGENLLDIAEFHYNLTTVDPPELVHFIKNEFPFVKINHPDTTMWKLIEKKRMPPTRIVRYCCSEMKEQGGTGRFTVTGVRKEESFKRSQRGAFEQLGKTVKDATIYHLDNTDDRRILEHCLPKRQYICNPIINWTDEDVWDFIHEENLPYCKLYDEGFSRLGCIGCPLATKKKRLLEFERWPKYKEAYIRAFDRMIRKRKNDGLKTDWKNGQEVFDWWIQ